MAMLPFVGYNMSDYFEHWLDMGVALGDKAPKIFNVNWFRTDDNGDFIWPGFGENFRVLKWIIGRCDGTEAKNAYESEIGYLPKEIDFDGLELSDSAKAELFKVDKGLWQEELRKIQKFYDTLDYIPGDLKKILELLKERLK